MLLQGMTCADQLLYFSCFLQGLTREEFTKEVRKAILYDVVSLLRHKKSAHHGSKVQSKGHLLMRPQVLDPITPCFQ